jgi:hypothetical protein
LERVLFSDAAPDLDPEVVLLFSLTSDCGTGLGGGLSAAGKLGTSGRGGMRGDTGLRSFGSSRASILPDGGVFDLAGVFRERSKAMPGALASGSLFLAAGESLGE